MARTVVLIDDDQDDLDLIKEIIGMVDGSALCISFIYPQEALRVVSRELIFVPDYIFIDINMPFLTGDKLLEAFRKNKEFDNVIITMFSTSMPEDIATSLRSAGANYTFKKPSHLEEYHKIITTIFEN